MPNANNVLEWIMCLNLKQLINERNILDVKKLSHIRLLFLVLSWKQENRLCEVSWLLWRSYLLEIGGNKAICFVLFAPFPVSRVAKVMNNLLFTAYKYFGSPHYLVATRQLFWSNTDLLAVIFTKILFSNVGVAAVIYLINNIWSKPKWWLLTYMTELMNRERRTVQMVTNNHCLVNPLNKLERRMCPFEVINNVYFSFDF